MERVEEASGSQFPQHHIPEAVQSPHAPILLSSVFNTRQADKVYTLYFCADSNTRTGESRTPSQLREFHDRSDAIRMLCQELNRIGTSSVMERRLEKAS